MMFLPKCPENRESIEDINRHLNRGHEATRFTIKHLHDKMSGKSRNDMYSFDKSVRKSNAIIKSCRSSVSLGKRTLKQPKKEGCY